MAAMPSEMTRRLLARPTAGAGGLPHGGHGAMWQPKRLGCPAPVGTEDLDEGEAAERE